MLIAAMPPQGDEFTSYDEAHLVTYLRLLDADAKSVDWKVTAQLVLSLDVEENTKVAKRTYRAHLARARWMTRVGYQYLLK